MTYERVLLDLDRTLLDTDAVTAAVLHALHTLYGLPEAELTQEVPTYYVGAGNLRYYDFFTHITAKGIDPLEAVTKIRATLAGKDFLYPDAHALLNFLAHAPQQVSVVSYGPANYQDFKFSLVPELQHMPFVTVLELKSAYLARLAAAPTLLVDDRVVAPLPGWCDQFIIDRSAPSARTQESPQSWRVNTLAVVESAIGVGYNERNQKEIR